MSETSTAAPPAATGAITARILPPAEWATRLVGTALEGAPIHPDYGFIVVVEQDDRVMACWGAMTTVHVEGLWQAPDAGAGVSRALIAAMLGELTRQQIGEVLTNAATPAVETLLETFGAARVPGTTWVIDLKGRT